MVVNISGNSAQSIFESVRDLIMSGALQSGDTLPPVRELAEQLGVNRNTVSAAYQRLAKAGVAITRGRLGTRICAAPTSGEQEGTSATSLYDLADGSPRRDWLPNLNQISSQTPLHQYIYGEATTLPEVYEYAKRWFTGICPKGFDITLSNGAIDALERLMTAHLSMGDKVVVEDPCYISSANAIRLAGIQVLGAQVDEQGMMPDALHAALEKGAQAVLITPRAHNPTGASLSAERARELTKVLADYPGVLVMVDDHFCLLAKDDYHSIIPDGTYHWAVFRSVSKGLGPDLRMAFIAADKNTVKRINTRMAPGMSWVSRVLQSLVYTCLSSDEVNRQLAEVKQRCIDLRALLINALADNGIEVTTTSDGLNVWIPIPNESKEITYELSRKGWLVRPGASFDIDQSSQAIRVSIQKIDAETVSMFAADLASIVVR
ncbi:aminotransferase class I/II-fold pyridoxal phosphate-dependent enzyme [Lacimicrobium alkaliphilum]|uniref:GntR family transcriptional regulator n=1 Tax=Lacimicrobium alkaliphilum TaxID=1526571 RepID=A0ABQ1RAL3_9ALTE|nr:aminotransferase class I/II-fold pyridoxal phosphate-dependent enzyme [Lacimicrobium alkaliphilum]GGD60800.1 GntR family transcriptional regulator [Lacimicrobium alkaliphilum]